jgi:hypothetical protein
MRAGCRASALTGTGIHEALTFAAARVESTANVRIAQERVRLLVRIRGLTAGLFRSRQHPSEGRHRPVVKRSPIDLLHNVTLP